MLELFLDHRHHDRGRQSLARDVAVCEPEAIALTMREIEVAGERARGTRERGYLCDVATAALSGRGAAGGSGTRIIYDEAREERDLDDVVCAANGWHFLHGRNPFCSAAAAS